MAAVDREKARVTNEVHWHPSIHHMRPAKGVRTDVYEPLPDMVTFPTAAPTSAGGGRQKGAHMGRREGKGGGGEGGRVGHLSSRPSVRAWFVKVLHSHFPTVVLPSARTIAFCGRGTVWSGTWARAGEGGGGERHPWRSAKYTAFKSAAGRNVEQKQKFKCLLPQPPCHAAERCLVSVSAGMAPVCGLPLLLREESFLSVRGALRVVQARPLFAVVGSHTYRSSVARY